MQSFTLVSFGITSNLSQIKLIPALYDMEEKKLLPPAVEIVGIARRKMSDKEFKDYIFQTLKRENIHHKHEIKKEVFLKLCKRLKYVSGDIEDRSLYEKLKKVLKAGNKIYYLATYPELYKYVFENLQRNGLNKGKG